MCPEKITNVGDKITPGGASIGTLSRSFASFIRDSFRSIFAVWLQSRGDRYAVEYPVS